MKKNNTTGKKVVEVSSKKTLRPISEVFKSPTPDELRKISKFLKEDPAGQNLLEIIRAYTVANQFAVKGVIDSFEEMRKWQENILRVAEFGNQAGKFGEEIRKQLMGAVDAVNLIQHSLTVPVERLSVARGMLIALPLKDLKRSIDPATKLTVDFEGLSSSGAAGGYKYSAGVSKEVTFGAGEYVSSYELCARIDKVKDAQEKINRKMDKILKYFDNKQTAVARIRALRYQKKKFVLIVNGHCIDLRSSQKKRRICDVLFKDGKACKRKFHLDEVADLVGERPSSKKEWKAFGESVRLDVRHLNEAVAAEAGIKDLVLFKDKTLRLKPKYR